MDENRPSFNVGVIKASECLSEGWRLIKDDYWLFLGISLVGVVMTSVASFIVAGPVMCGIYLCMLRRHEGKKISFEMFFQGFNYFLESLIATLLMMVPIFVGIFLFYAIFCCGFFGVMIAAAPQRGQPPEPTSVVLFVVLGAVVFLLFVLAMLVLQSLFVFNYFLIVDKGLSGWEATKLSVQAGWANLGGVIRVMLLELVITLAGMLACYIGAIFVIPIGYAMVTIAYLQVFGDASPDAELPPDTSIAPARF